MNCAEVSFMQGRIKELERQLAEAKQAVADEQVKWCLEAERLADHAWAIYKGREPEKASEPFQRASAYTEGWSDGAREIAARIRGGEKK